MIKIKERDTLLPSEKSSLLKFLSTNPSAEDVAKELAGLPLILSPIETAQLLLVPWMTEEMKGDILGITIYENRRHCRVINRSFVYRQYHYTAWSSIVNFSQGGFYPFVIKDSSSQMVHDDVLEDIYSYVMAKKRKDFAASDLIRKVLKGGRIDIQDVNEGVLWFYYNAMEHC